MEKGDEGEKRLLGVLEEWLKEPSDKTDDAVFMESYIPRTLAEVYDPERDVDVLKRGGGDELIYAGVTGLKLAHESANAKEREKESAGVGAGVDANDKDEQVGVDESVERGKKGKSKSKDEGGKNKKSTKSVRFEDGVNEQDEEDDAQKAEEEGDEEEGMDKKSRGFRHEDRESKKVRLTCPPFFSSILTVSSDHFSLISRLISNVGTEKGSQGRTERETKDQDAKS